MSFNLMKIKDLAMSRSSANELITVGKAIIKFSEQKNTSAPYLNSPTGIYPSLALINACSRIISSPTLTCIRVTTVAHITAVRASEEKTFLFNKALIIYISEPSF